MNIATTRGRIGRLHYLLALIVILVPAGVLIGIGERENSVALYLTGVALALVSICPGVQRLHDVNQSGWLLLLSIFPVINIGLGLFMLLRPGTAGPNDYGPDPRAHEPRAA